MADVISLESFTLNLNGIEVDGWADDADAFTPPTVDSLAERVGADGKMVVVATGNKGGEVIVKLMPNSRAGKQIMNAYAAQVAGVVLQWNGIGMDHRNNVVTSFIGGYLKRATTGPTMGKGAVGNFEFTFVFEKIIPDYSGALFL